jgi:hypothetical protein
MSGTAAQGAIAQVQKVISNQASELDKDLKEALESFNALGHSQPNGILAKSLAEKATEHLRLAGRSVHTTLQASALFSSLTQEEMKKVRHAVDEGLRTIAEGYRGAMERYRLGDAKGGVVDATLNGEILKLATLFGNR